MPNCAAERLVGTDGRGPGMSRDQYRAKAEELKAKSQEDYSPIIRVARGPGRSVGRSGKSAQKPGTTSPTSMRMIAGIASEPGGRDR